MNAVSAGERTVALVVPGAAGGIAAHARSLLGRLPALGWQVRLCAPPAVLGQLLAPGNTVPVGVELVALRSAANALTGVVDPRGAADLRAALAGVDAVDAQGLRAATAVLGAVGPRSAPWRIRGPSTPAVVVTLHNPPPGRGATGLLGAAAHRRVVRGATLVLAASDDLLAAAAAAGARRPVLLAVGAPTTRPADPARARELRELLDPEGRGLLLTAGRLAPQKDHALVLTALSRLAPGRRPVFAIAGDGPLRAALAAAATALRLSVRLLGERRDLPDLLGAATAAVLSSRWEARSLFAQEALRAGVPAVVTDVGGLPGLVGDGAVLVAPGDAAALAAALDAVLHDESLRARLAVAGPRRAATWPGEDDTALAVAAALDRAQLLVWDSVER